MHTADARHRAAKYLGGFAFAGLLLAPLSATGADTTQLLSQAPPRAASAMQFEAPLSTIAPTVEVPYKLIEAAANAAADRFSGPRSGKTRIGCQNVTFGASLPVKVTLFHGCADFDWEVTASRNGNITVKRAGNGIAMDVPVKFTGDGSFEGDLARAIRTGKQNFAGTFTVSISGTVDVNKSFCPVVENAAAHFAWGTAPDIDIIDRSCLGVGHGLNACIGPWKFPAGKMLTDRINHVLTQQVDEINRKIPCDTIRDQLHQVWKNWSIPVPIVNPPLYVTIQPKTLSVSNVTATDNGIEIAARLDAATGVSATPPPAAQPLPLPENTPVTPQASRFALAVPLPVPYPLLAMAGAGGIVGKQIRAGKDAVTPTEVEIYPDHDQLAVGVTLRDDGHGPLRGKMGTVWFTATPTVDDNGHAIRLGKVSMTQDTRTPLWHAVSAAVEPKLPQALANSYSYDFSGLLQQARSALDRALADPKNTGGVKISVTNDDLKLGRTANLPDSFVIEGLFDADVSATVQNPPR
ncbi:MAG: DUF4403 family protein [Rhizomicrobium sp.]